ncbi:iron ABC transporter permease [Asticcacaulis sp. AND118]|uniref:FecCD family ABC transporter permease n=1 Tax=Asticcacaulis sp. AND118 TaxID=2840468 RepID=UPI001CFFBA61|nr:iron ABC transporter permease [Asticcacaulis sp. AND118]UDF02450.1 iron ABC transporter permease [Asticcacaulis sp. AND118]
MKVWTILAGVTALLLIALMGMGEVALSPADYAEALRAPGSLAGEILWQIRLPRNLCALLVGAMLGVAGAVAQGYFRNPLAEPGIMGVSAGAGLGAAVAIVLGLGLTPGVVEGFALLFAGGVSLIILGFVSRFPDRQALILLGVGLSSLCGALMALVFNLSPSPVTTAEILGWMMGSVENRSWQDAGMGIGGLFVAAVLLWKLGPGLRLLTLGEDTARSQGVDVRKLAVLSIVAISLLAGLAVAVAGVIGFVGLAAPHLVRSLGVRDPYKLIAPSGLAGGLMVLLADGAVRLLPTSTDIRLGVLTSLIGAPLFALLAWKSAKEWVQG